MNQTFRIASSTLLILTLALPGLGRAASFESPRPNHRINVRIFNYASVSKSAFDKAQKEASRIFRRSGIEINWIECAVADKSVTADPRCTAKPLATDILMRIVPKEMVKFKRRSEFGVAFLPAEGGFGKYASVFHARVLGYVERWHASEGLLLGHFISHEMGHLLLGANSHSHGGLMTAIWGREAIQRASRAALLFSSQEATRMQEQVNRRSTSSRATRSRTVATSDCSARSKPRR